MSRSHQAKTVMCSPARKKTKASNDEVALWRKDPKESFSDWTIQICLEDDLESKVTKEYHVHRSELAHGERKCEYFSKLFQNEFAESQTNTTLLKLPKLAADVFGLFLDHIYGTNHHTDSAIDTESAVPLLYLADRFGQLTLQKVVIDNIERDRDDLDYECFDHLCIFLRHSQMLQCKPKALLDELEVRVESMFHFYPEMPRQYHHILQYTDVTFWVNLFGDYKKWGTIFWETHNVSNVLWYLCRHYQDDMSMKDFEALTHLKWLGLWRNEKCVRDFKFGREKAEKVLNLLQIEEKISGKEANGVDSEFQKRCVKFFASDIRSISRNHSYLVQRPQLVSQIFWAHLAGESD